MLSAIFQPWLGRDSLVAADDTWSLLFVLCAGVALAIYLEQKYDWAAKASGCILCLVLAMILSNLGILPINSALYDDVIWGYAVPMAIPLLLMECNLKVIWKETGRILIIFLIGAVGTLVGAAISFTLLKNMVPEPAGVAAMMTGTYIGGSLNLAALSDEFGVTSEVVGAATVADNLLMAVYFFVLIMFAGMKFFRRHFGHPHIDEVAAGHAAGGENQAAAFWSRKGISLKDVAMNLAYTVIIVWLSKLIGGFIGELVPTSNMLLSMINAFFGSQYIWIATLSMLMATYAGDKIGKLNGSQEIGTYFIYLFFFVIGVPASIIVIITQTPALFLFTGIMVACNMLFCFLGGKLLRFDLEDCIMASNANIGGPTTAAGMAISQGWSKLVGPVMLIGTFGYVIGTYLGVIVGNLLGA